MATRKEIDPALRKDMVARNIDVDLSLSILDAFNAGEFDRFTPIEVDSIPEPDGSTIVDFTGNPEYTCRIDWARDRLSSLLPDQAIAGLPRIGTPDGDSIRFDAGALRTLGLLLLPRVSYGVLNGGSATSYADTKKNSGFDEGLYRLLQTTFEQVAEVSRGRPKGLTPAFVQPDGSLGPSFLQLKMRNLLILNLAARDAYREYAPGLDSGLPEPLLPFFQMTSIHTETPLDDAYREYRSDPLLADLIQLTGANPTRAVGAVQPLLSAYTHSELGRPKRIFAAAYGRQGETLPIPGGHGQNFAVLADVYRELHRQGKRFVYLGNVDNLGFLPDPVAIAYLALSGKQAGFDFAFKTPVDVKGGILVRDTAGALNCADIGPAISKEEVARAESAGKPILFNAASGLFDLDYLVRHLDRIARDLPTRFTDQNKDAGRYSQAEQVTWEVLGMLDDFLVFSVSKWDRLLAAKLLLETLMTSGVAMDDPAYPKSDDPVEDLLGTAKRLNQGLQRRLAADYGMKLDGRVWTPVPADQLGRGEG